MKHEKLKLEETANSDLDAVSIRFSIIKTILSDFALFAIIDNELNKVVCHLVYDNGEEYCEEMANKMLDGLNNRQLLTKRSLTQAK